MNERVPVRSKGRGRKIRHRDSGRAFYTRVHQLTVPQAGGLHKHRHADGATRSNASGISAGASAHVHKDCERVLEIGRVRHRGDPQVTLKNESNYDVKDITLKFGYWSDSKTQLGSNVYTIYKVLPKGKTKTFNDLNTGFVQTQATRGGVVEIVSVEVVKK